jgi:hypothetical protein
MAAINFPTRAQLVSLINTNLAGSPTTIKAIDHRDVENSIVNAIYNGQIGDIKEVACNATYITDNFDATGKGRQNKSDGTPAERYGWAICNGQNGTVDKRGNVSIGYDPINYPTLAPIQSLASNAPATKQGGSKDAVVVSHTHDLREDLNAVNMSGSPIQGSSVPIPRKVGGDWRTTSGSGDPANDTTQLSVVSSGISGIDKNMQPYVVTLFIQRIAI